MSQPNPFTQGPLGPIFLKTTLPIVFVMGMNGLLTVVDAIFLGHYVGEDALGAVTLIFPLYMLIVALATLVSSGMSSILARNLGAEDMTSAKTTFAGAHGLAVCLGSSLIILYLALGEPLTLILASGSATLADMAQTYLQITSFAAPLTFVLAINSDALRNEGAIGFMASISLLTSLSNIAFNYLLIAQLGLGVAGSAYGTALAQALALCAILGYRVSGRTPLHPRSLRTKAVLKGWQHILALGAPQSLNFIGIALGSAAIIAALQMIKAPNYETLVSAYGIITRVLTFAFLPLLGLTHAMQSIIGNNYGAHAWGRSDQGLRIALALSCAYCVGVQVIFSLGAVPLGALFVTDTEVIAAFARILPVTIIMLWLAGPLIIIASYFQAIGDAPRAGILGLTKPYLFALPLTFLLPLIWGEIGIWLAGPAAEILMAGLTLLVLRQTASRTQLKHGLFRSADV